MSETAIILERNIQNDLQTIAEIYQKIDTPALSADVDEEALIVLAYRLHSLYMTFENIFRNIAMTFENNVDDSFGWHSQLLQRMTLDLMPIRPAVIDKNAFNMLDELRRFRHLFRNAYQTEFDPERLQLVINKALALRNLYPTQINQFLSFVQMLK
jgi:hypothetical protein